MLPLSDAALKQKIDDCKHEVLYCIIISPQQILFVIDGSSMEIIRIFYKSDLRFLLMVSFVQFLFLKSLMLLLCN